MQNAETSFIFKTRLYTTSPCGCPKDSSNVFHNVELIFVSSVHRENLSIKKKKKVYTHFAHFINQGGQVGMCAVKVREHPSKDIFASVKINTLGAERFGSSHKIFQKILKIL